MQARVSPEPVFFNTVKTYAQALKNTDNTDLQLDTSLSSLFILNVYKYTH